MATPGFDTRVGWCRGFISVEGRVASRKEPVGILSWLRFSTNAPKLQPTPFNAGDPRSGAAAVVNGAANATSGVSALRASIPCRKQCSVRLRRTDLFCPSPSRLSRCSLRQRRKGGVLRCAPPPSKSHQRHRVTIAARRDAPAGVGTRNVPQDSPTPPAGRTRNNGEQAKVPCPSQGRRPCPRRPSEHLSSPASPAPPHRDRPPSRLQIRRLPSQRPTSLFCISEAAIAVGTY
jgi:hypothetical protein